jgi:flavin-dependent dehydrogenase
MVSLGKTVSIAGAGPAGLTCAIALAEAGRAVKVFDGRPRSLVADGGFEILDNWTGEADALALFDSIGVSTAAFLSPARDAELFDGELRRTRVSSQQPFAYLVRRGAGESSLDGALEERAHALGVEFRFGEELPLPDADVVATGPGAADLAVKRTVFRSASPERLQFLFDPERARGGFSWLAIAGGLGTMECSTVGDARKLERDFEASLQQFRRVSEFSSTEERSVTGGVSCVVAGSSRLGAALVIGEAAGSTDVFLGFGLRGAIEDGLLAAESLSSGKSFDALHDDASARTRASLALRFRYEGMSSSRVRRAIRRLARGDFRERLKDCARPSFAKETVALLARAVWGRPASCSHVLPDHWCRRRET